MAASKNLMNELFPIEGNKILLRPFTIEDQTAKNRIDNVDDIKEFLGPTTSLEKDIEEFKRQGFGLVSIVDINTGNLVGYAKLQYPIDWDKDLGLELVLAVAPEARNNGMAQEAAQILIDLACGELDQKEIVARVAQNNYASLNLVEKLGMKKTGNREGMFEGTQVTYAVTCGKLAG